MKNKKTILAVIALVLVVGILAAVYLFTRPEARDAATGAKFTVTVVHEDGSEKVFGLQSEALYLGEVLISEGIVEGEEGPYGLMISAADGEVADWNVDQSYWAIFIGEEYATTGADQIPIYEGSEFSLVYTIG